MARIILPISRGITQRNKIRDVEKFANHQKNQ